ncbi:MAG: hypothetical protein GX913_02465 [Clostridiales bacterium]|nr:hypothetical protein [Clostridiales bacterium]
MEEIVIEKKKLKAMLKVAGGSLLVFASVMLFSYGLRQKIVIYWIMGLIAILFFGILFLNLLSGSLEMKPLLTITFDGIIDSSSKSSVGFISYQDIEEFCIIRLYGRKVIGIIPKDENDFINKLSPVKQVIAKSNVNMKFSPCTIRADRAKDMSLEDIFTLLKKRLDDYRCLYD